jgi:ribosomal protein S12 methylthiotransferase
VDGVPPAVKAERRDRLMAVQQPISLARNQAQVGRVLDVLIEGWEGG